MTKAKSNNVGRPVKYTESKIERIRVKFEKYIEDTPIPIISEFAYLNDIPRRKLYELKELKHTIKRCVDKKESALERQGLDKSKATPMHIFSLKQLGWSDTPTIISENEDKTHLTKLKDLNTNTFKVIKAIRNGKRLIVCRGGTRSGKSYGLAQLALDALFSKEYAGVELKGDLGLYSQSLPHLKGTLLEDIYNILEYRGLQEGVDYIHHKTAKYFQYDGLKIWYGSINNLKEAQKVKGKGLAVIFLNEADSIPYNAFQQLYMRGKENAIIVIDFNPDNEFGWINQEIELTDKYKNVEVIVSTFEDNDFISEEEKDRIRNLKNIDIELYQIFALGQYGSITGLVYPRWDKFTKLPEASYYTFYGLDLGYDPDPTALTEIKWKVGSRDLYIENKLYQTKLEASDVINAVRQINENNDVIYSDSNEGRLVGTMRTSGINIFTPKKGRLKMFKYVKNFRLHIKEDDIATQKELRTYKHLKDANGNYTKDAVKFNDHIVDSVGYGVIGLIEHHFRMINQALGDLK